MASDPLYFRQLLPGRDLGEEDFVAKQMVNFVYLVGDRETGEAVAVDPAYDIDRILQTLEADEMRLRRPPPTPPHPPAPSPPTAPPTTSAAEWAATASRGSASSSSASRCRSTCRPTKPSGCRRRPTSASTR